jgi:uncharacterized protein (TIGR03083 family)
MASNEMIEKMKVSYASFLQACKTLSEDQALSPGVCGEWTAKQVVDHLTGWQVESIEILDRLLRSDEEDIDLDIDGFNAKTVMERASLPWRESLDAFENSFRAFDNELAAISEEEYQAYSGLASWVRAMTHEYRFHLAHIRKAQES